MREPRLMIPGPIDVSQEVLDSMSRRMVAHYGSDWTEFYRETTSSLLGIFRTGGHVFLVPGSGSAGLEMVFASILFPNKKVLILQNGYFGERLEEIARAYTPNIRIIRAPLAKAIDLSLVQEALLSDQFDMVAAVHCETSTGMLNNVQKIADMCNQSQTLFMLDAISSLAVEPLEMDSWGIDICVSASQKGLESPPGLALVAVSKSFWKRIDHLTPAGWYLNLKVWKDYEEKWGDWHPHPITHAVNNVRALKTAIDRILSEGLEERYSRHRRITSSLREGLTVRGFEPLIPAEEASHGVTAVASKGRDVDALLKYLRQEKGLLLAGSLGELKGKVFRMGHMGTGASEEAIETLLDALDTLPEKT